MVVLWYCGCLCMGVRVLTLNSVLTQPLATPVCGVCGWCVPAASPTCGDVCVLVRSCSFAYLWWCVFWCVLAVSPTCGDVWSILVSWTAPVCVVFFFVCFFRLSTFLALFCIWLMFVWVCLSTPSSRCVWEGFASPFVGGHPRFCSLFSFLSSFPYHYLFHHRFR